ncbi:MAG: hypothetical protein Q8P46_18395 [Hyphomicrobiales bacterium]|nr:hypothetical protein [Hyphomicrobiales bacterium]
MRAFVRLFGVMLCALPLAACLLETKNTIIDNPLPIDESITGTWARAEDGSVWLLTIRPDDGDPTLGKIAYIYVEPGNDDIDVGRTLFDVRLTEIGAAIYFEAAPRGPDPFPDASNPIDRFIGRMALEDPDTLRIDIPETAFVREAIEAGRLEGEIKDGDPDATVTLTGTTSQIRAFLSASVPADPYGSSVYHRLK